MYVQLDRQFWADVPMCWDTCHSMFKHLSAMVGGYQLLMERRLFAVEGSPEYRCALVRWDGDNIQSRQRTMLLTTHEPQQMEAALLMLIKEAEQLLKERGI